MIGITEHLSARGLRIEHRDFRLERLEALHILHVPAIASSTAAGVSCSGAFSSLPVR